MTVYQSKLTAKAQTTIPQEVRRALKLEAGDFLIFEVSGERVTVRKKRPLDRDFLKAIEPMLSEWSTAEDAEAYDDLKPL
jgi:AbrB family looped-hinge helix DNA binding protein